MQQLSQQLKDRMIRVTLSRFRPSGSDTVDLVISQIIGAAVWEVFKRCLPSAECSMNVHHKCQRKVANLCGVNQKLMAEALAIIETKQQVGRRCE